MGLADALAAWRSLLGRDRVIDAPEAQARWGACTTGAARRICGAVSPDDARLVAEIVKIAAAHRVPLHPISTGHNWGYGTALPVRDDCVILDLSALRQIRDFDVDTGVVTVEPGVTQAMLAEFLEKGRHPFLV
ncbi:MAG TPA: FAD-binding protein, partial [Casimicrobiaceae bacterium]|nr:FAD-binding protein [Casimicrobiaceae bacterium]